MTATKLLRKFPRRPGAERFQAYFVPVEVVREEDRVEGFVTTKREFGDQYPGGYRDVWVKGEEVVRYALVREKGKQAKWVKVSDLK